LRKQLLIIRAILRTIIDICTKQVLIFKIGI
jgi:hypothetical protein